MWNFCSLPFWKLLQEGSMGSTYRAQALQCCYKMLFLILQGLHYSSSESALRECHLIRAAGRTVLQIRWKMMQILINDADKTINIPTSCSTYYLSLLTEPQLICSTPWLEEQHWYTAPLQHQQLKHWSWPQACGAEKCINVLFFPPIQLLLCSIYRT